MLTLQKIWEYWTVGIPVIATPLPGQSKMIAETGAGIAAELDKIKETVQEWIDSPQTARALGAKGRLMYLRDPLKEILYSHKQSNIQ